MRALNWIFFLLPFFLYVGVAGQVAGLYVFGLFLPGVLLAKQMESVSNGDDKLFESKRRLQALGLLRNIGLALIGLFAVFVATNFLNQWFAPGETIAQVPRPLLTLKQIFSSRFSTSLVFTGLFLIVLWALLSRRVQNQLQHNRLNERPAADEVHGLFDSFLWGSVFSISIILVYVLFQVATGFDYRLAGEILGEQNKLTATLYRAFGLYGHPLSLASVALAMFSFWWGTLWMRLQNEWGQFKLTDAHKVRNEKFHLNKTHFAIVWLSFVNLMFVALSGGRTALAVACVFLLVLPMTAVLPKHLAKVRNLFVLMIAALGLVVMFPALSRLTNLVSSILDGAHFDRFTFWKVHFKIFTENPIWGQGSAWLDAYARSAYYDAMGYQTLHDKFNAHNFYLEVLAGAGVFGFVAIAALLLYLAGNIARLVFSNVSPNKYLSVCLFYALLANLLHGLTQNTFFDAHVSIALLYILSVVMFQSFYKPRQG